MKKIVKQVENSTNCFIVDICKCITVLLPKQLFVKHHAFLYFATIVVYAASRVKPVVLG